MRERYLSCTLGILISITQELVADPLQKPVFLFPGQGVQKVGMANDFIVHPSALALFQRAQQILGYDLLDICTNGVN